MELTNRQILHSVEGLNKLNELKLPAKISYRLAKISRKLDACLKDYQTVLSKLRSEYETSEKKLDHPDFKRQLEELLECKNPIDLEKIKLESLGDVTVEPLSLYHLDWLIEE